MTRVLTIFLFVLFGLTAETKIVSDQVSVNTLGAVVKAPPVRNDYSSVNVTTAAYVELVASTAQDLNGMEIFDSSGQSLVIAFGAAASEVDQYFIHPGGNVNKILLEIPKGTRIAIKAISANATVGELLLNFYGR